MANVHKGKPKTARKAYSKLAADEKKTIKKNFKSCLEVYMSHLEAYLQSLSKEVNFVVVVI